MPSRSPAPALRRLVAAGGLALAITLSLAVVHGARASTGWPADLTVRLSYPPSEAARLLHAPEVVVTVCIPASRTVSDVRGVIEGEEPIAAPAPGSSGERDTLAAPIVETRGEGFLRGYRLASFAVRPLRTDPTTGGLTVVTSLRLEIALSASDANAVERRVEGPGVDERTRAALRRFVANPDAVSPSWRAGRPPARTIEAAFRPTPDGSAVEYVIVTADSLASAFQPFADWRTARGIQTVVRTIGWIADTYPHGADLAETIRTFLRDAYANWGTTDVLLGGDVGVVPYRNARTEYYGGETIPTDLYFQGLDGNWNADGDSLYGEAGGDSVPADAADLYPEVNVGRLPANNAADVAAWFAKLQAFEAPPAGFATRALFLSEVLFPSDWVPGDPRAISLDGATLTQDAAADLPSGFTVTRLYQNAAAYPGAIPETPQAALDSLDAGYAIVEHMGHGYVQTLSVGSGSIVTADVDGLTNATRAGIIYAVNCNSASFDYASIGERFVVAPGGGAVAYVGATRYDFPVTLTDYQNSFFALLYQDSVYTLGDAYSLSKAEYASRSLDDGSDRWTQFSMNLLGDPTLAAYRREPRALAVSHAGTATLGGSSYSVTVTIGGAPVRGARVAAMKAGEAYGVAYTDSRGIALVPFVPFTTGRFAIAASAPNELTRTDSASVIDAPGPALEVESVRVADGDAPFSKGNVDGKANPGETVGIVVTLRNDGGAVAPGVVGTLSTTDNYLEITDATASFGTIDTEPRDVIAIDPFMAVVLAGAPADHQARCTLRLRDGQNRISQRTVLVPLYPPDLSIARSSVRDTIAGDGNGIVDAGEIADYAVTLVNTGSGTAEAVVLHLASADLTTLVLDSLAVAGTVPAGGESAASSDAFRFQALAPGAHPLFLWGTDAYGGFAVPRRVVDFVAPPAPVNLSATEGERDIALAWARVPDADLVGYAVYRATNPDGPFARVNATLDYCTAYYKDEGLVPLTRYFYTVAAVDSSANESPRSAVLVATTTLPLRVGWPVALGTPTSAAVVPANIDGSPDGSLELVTGGTRVVALHGDGSEAYDGDGDPQTLGPISAAGVSFSSGPTVADVDGDGRLEIAAVSYDAGPKTSTIYVFRGSDGSIASGWPKVIPGFAWGSPTLGDIDGDGDRELITGSSDGKIYAWHAGGAEVRDGDGSASTDGVFAVTGGFVYGSVALADLDHDGVREIIVGSGDGNLYAWNADGTSVPGWPYAAGGAITASPAVGDFDGDGVLEVAVGSMNNVFHVVSETGQVRWQRWFAQYTSGRTPSPAFADLDGDGFLDVIVASTAGRLYAFNRSSQALPGWTSGGADGVPYGSGLSEVSQCSPIVVDVDGDGRADVLQGAEDGTLNAFGRIGTPLAGFPLRISGPVRGTPAVWDVDGSGRTAIALAGYDGTMYLWDGGADFDAAHAPWPVFHHDAAGWGATDAPVVPDGTVTGIGDGTAPGALSCVQLGIPRNGSPLRLRVTIPGASASPQAPVRLALFDARGRRVVTLVDAPLSPGVHEVAWDRRAAGGARTAAGVLFARLYAGGAAVTRRVVLLP